MEPTSNQAPTRRFAIAVSFPGEHRDFVLKVVEQLAEELGRERVFYDEWYEKELVGVDGDLKLRWYYREQSEYVVPFFSQHYHKPWCDIEWSSIRAMLLDRRAEDAVVPVDMDGTPIEGWEKIDFPIRRKNRSAREIAKVILDVYRHRKAHEPSSSSLDSPHLESTIQQETLGDGPATNVHPTAEEPGLEPQAMISRAKEQLEPLAEQLLTSDVTRQFILKHNQLPSATSARELAQKIFQSSKPMDFLRSCTKRSKPYSPGQLEELNETIWRLVQVLAPVCLRLDDLNTLEQYLQGLSEHAELSTADLTVAKSQVALFKKVSVDLKTKLNWEHFHYDDLPKDRDRVTAVPHPPHVGIYGDGGEGREDIVDVFTEGLIRFLNPDKPHRMNVRAALKELAEQDKVFICVFLPARLSPSNLKRLAEAYPELILLVQCASEDTFDNATVLDQIKRIREEFCPYAD